MNTKVERAVMERDLRRPEFREGDPSEYEFDGSGEVVRKDRWETGIRRLCVLAGISSREKFVVDDLVTRLKSMLGGDATWQRLDEFDRDDYGQDRRYVLRLKDGSLLRDVEVGDDGFVWRGMTTSTFEVEAFKVEV